MSWPSAPLLRTERLALEPLAVEHADEMVNVLAPPGLYRFTGGEPPTLADLRARYARQSRGRSPDGTEGWSNWILRPVAGGAAVGFTQATLAREEDLLVADLAWLVVPSEQGRGLASEAATAVGTWLRSVGVRRFRAFVHPDHEASARVARRIGLEPTATYVDGEVLWQAHGP